MTALRMAWKSFAKRNDEQIAAFRYFVDKEGESLYWQAAFDALHAYQVKEDPMRWGWPVWPEAYRTTDSPEVHAFCKKHGGRGGFLPVAAMAGIHPICRLLAGPASAMRCRLASTAIWRWA
ncbi:4-alpha-glucanotransferase [Kluyvera cryocrescens]|uniref:4-alpha-glucanotransferase n=1 Tax=Kluyvera cryocrescens TaxID=580 RepID=A0A485AGC2_KLUCR|nr:4-alpha-glucanotransferase [Kluyvera cryocrescens]